MSPQFKGGLRSAAKSMSLADPKVILFVCTGNLCRSPMAAGLLRHRLEVDGLDGAYEARSVGTWAVIGEPAAIYACQVMANRGIDIAAHRAQSISAEAIAEADLILVMTEAHREAIQAEFPDARSKTYLLSEMIDKRYDIADPYGSSLAHYEYCAEDLASIIEAGYKRILDLVDKGAA